MRHEITDYISGTNVDVDGHSSGINQEGDGEIFLYPEDQDESAPNLRPKVGVGIAICHRQTHDLTTWSKSTPMGIKGFPNNRNSRVCKVLKSAVELIPR